MNYRTILGFCLFFLIGFTPFAYSAERITMKTGDIFIGTIKDQQYSRFHIDRFGYLSIIPTWEIKQVEPSQNTLPMSAEIVPMPPAIKAQVIIVPSVIRLATGSKLVIPTPTPTPLPHLRDPDAPHPINMRLFALMGKNLPVLSAPPAEPSHLEMYPKQSHPQVEKNRYLRGYLVNQTSRGYYYLRVQVTFYTVVPLSPGSQKNHTNFKNHVDLFKVYPMTMKPFIVDTQFVEWDQVKQISFQIISRKPL